MAETKDTSAEVLHLKKYPNRRYYDSAHSRHLKLQEIYDLVKAGHSIQVTEGQDDRDITAEVLLGILLEFEPEKVTAIPASVLSWWIRADAQKARELIGNASNPVWKALVDYKEQIKTELQSSPTMQEIIPALKGLAKEFVAPFKEGMAESKPPEAKSDKAAPPPHGQNEDLEELIRALDSEQQKKEQTQ